MTDYNEQEVYVRNGINAACTKYYSESKSRGWWDDPHLTYLIGNGQTDLAKTAAMQVYATKIALVHSEVSEALEGLRRGKMDEHLPHRNSVEVELADALIRIFDLAGRLNIDLGGAVVEKGRYNMKRADHEKEHRAGTGGKKF